MKKFSFLCLAIAATLTASAQISVLKEAKKAAGAEKPELATVVKIITPAFEDPETATMAETWYVPGKVAFKEYDNLLGLSQFGKLGEDGPIKMANLLLQGYDYFSKALPLDTIVDPKGKIKTKFSKEICNTFAGHFGDYSTGGVNLYNAKDYDGAYKAWGIFCELPQNPGIRKAIGEAMPADSVFGELAFNQALAAWQGEKLPEALAAFKKAKNFGYKKKQLYDYAIAVAQGMDNKEELLAFSEEALPLYGTEDPMYMGQIVNYYLQSKQLDKAFDVINQAIAMEPNNAQYYVIQGVLYENAENKPAAKEAYAKALQLNPENDQAVYNYGRQLCEEAFALADQAPTRQDEYNVYFADKIKPLFEEAATVLEKAYTLNPDNTDVLKYLENVYYNLSDEKMLNDVKKRMAY